MRKESHKQRVLPEIRCDLRCLTCTRNAICTKVVNESASGTFGGIALRFSMIESRKSEYL